MSAPLHAACDILTRYMGLFILGCSALALRQPELFRRIRPFMAGRKVLGIRCVAEPSWFVQVQPEEASFVPDKAEPLPSAFAAIADATSREALGRLWRICQARRARTGTPDFPSKI